MLCLGLCYCQFPYGRYIIIWADVITHVLSFGRYYCLFNVVVVGKTLHHMCGLIMADVIAKWQDGTATFLFVLRMADVIAMWQDGTATFVLKMADVIARW